MVKITGYLHSMQTTESYKQGTPEVAVEELRNKQCRKYQIAKRL